MVSAAPGCGECGVPRRVTNPSSVTAWSSERTRERREGSEGGVELIAWSSFCLRSAEDDGMITILGTA